MRSFHGRDAHLPEEAAARYVDGGGDRPWRQRFEGHLLECEDCWGEVRAARAGRSLAERARELAPAGLREDVRAAVSLSGAPARRRRTRLLTRTALAIALTMVGGAFVLLGPLSQAGQPRPIRVALASYRSDRVPASAPRHLAPDLTAAGLQLVGGGRELLDGMSVDVFGFADPAGHRLFVFLGDRRFPEATGATERGGTVHRWRAVADGVHMVCADAPVSYLVMGADPSLVQRAEDALRQGPLMGLNA